MSDIANTILAEHNIEIGGELKQYGTKGMKWGVRKDRTGKPAKAKREVSEDHVTSRKTAAKKPSEMSTAELKKLNERLQLEKTNRELQSRGALQKIKTGTAIAGTILAVGTTITTAYNFVNSPAGKAVIAATKKALDNS